MRPLRGFEFETPGLNVPKTTPMEFLTALKCWNGTKDNSIPNLKKSCC